MNDDRRQLPLSTIVALTSEPIAAPLPHHDGRLSCRTFPALAQ
ncbi:MAG: hypothetical protein OJJ55_26150 [Rhodococcus sp.]|nr:hypothetical protein [Rhodococcus sp. (in: high G+C Gram-positive bacteria)]